MNLAHKSFGRNRPPPPECSSILPECLVRLRQTLWNTYYQYRQKFLAEALDKPKCDSPASFKAVTQFPWLSPLLNKKLLFYRNYYRWAWRLQTALTGMVSFNCTIARKVTIFLLSKTVLTCVRVFQEAYRCSRYASPIRKCTSYHTTTSLQFTLVYRPLLFAQIDAFAHLRLRFQHRNPQ